MADCGDSSQRMGNQSEEPRHGHTRLRGDALCKQVEEEGEQLRVRVRDCHNPEAVQAAIAAAVHMVGEESARQGLVLGNYILGLVLIV